MARTLIGQLILRLRAEGLGEANKVAKAMRDVEAQARRVSNAPVPPWGIGFQRQIDKLKLAPREFEAVHRSWATMVDEMRRKNVTGALRASEISNWKNATVSQLALARGEIDRHMRDVEERARRHARLLNTTLRPFMVAGGAYTATYGAGVVGRQGVIAGAKEERERFRADMAGIPREEQEALFAEAERLSVKYRAASFTEIAEMARNAKAMMGSTERGIAVLEAMVQGLVTLKSSKGADAGPQELARLLRAVDNLGKNTEGEIGIKDTAAIIDGLVRASQIEGRELDVGQMFDFARRAKIAGPALGTDFIMTTAAALAQDMTAAGFGTGLSSAYQSLVIGSNATASKVNLAEQRRLGLRTGDGKGELVDASLFGTNPYEWVKRYLVPALERDGVDTTDDTATAQAVAKLARNTMATGLLARMVQQREQIDRLVEAYSGTMGLDAAEAASVRDPFVAWEGFKSSLENLSGAMGGMPQISSGLNTLADLINNLQQRIRDGDPTVSTAATVAGVGAAGGGALLLTKGIHGLLTAGTNLNTAAANLNLAASRLGGGIPGGGDGGKNQKGNTGIPIAGPLTIGYLLYEIAKATKRQGDQIEIREPAPNTPGDYFNRLRDSNLNSQNEKQDGPGAWARFFFGKAADPDFNFREHMKINAGIDREHVGTETATAASDEARGLKGELDALAGTVTPTIDSSNIKAARRDAEALLATLRQIGSAARQAASNVGAQLRRNYSD